MHRATSSFLFATALTAGIFSLSARAEPVVIELTQVACQFIESEHGQNHGFTTNRKSDCEQINNETGSQRLQDSKVIELEPGEYVFRVTNVDVPYALGFWLRGDGLISRATLPSVSGGGLTAGTTRDYKITLEPGDYVYSCPLNPTPDYKLTVRASS